MGIVPTSNMSLDAHPGPHVAVDLVLLAVTPRPDGRTPSLGVVVQRRADSRAVLPGRFVRERETVRQTVTALLADKLDFRPRHRLELDMIDVFDDPTRDERGWAISLAYAATIRPDDAGRLARGPAEIIAVSGPASRGSRVTGERLGYDHDQMVTTAVRRLRRRYEKAPDPRRLSRPPWTLSDLRHVHEAVLDEPLKRDTFKRRMEPFLEPAVHPDGRPIVTTETGGRPAQLFRPKSRPPREPESDPFPLPRSRP